MRAIYHAFKQYGTKEISGKEDNPEVVKYFHEIGFNSSAIKDETAWCSAFVNWCVLQSNMEPTRKLNATSWLEWGQKTLMPQFGDIVIFWRGKNKGEKIKGSNIMKGHVAFYVTERHGWTWVLGGNQANQVKISAYPTSKVLGYRKG